MTTVRVGQLVRDEASGRVGVLMYCGAWEDPTVKRYGQLPSRVEQLAFLRPVRGGIEWTTCPGNVTPLECADSV